MTHWNPTMFTVDRNADEYVISIPEDAITQHLVPQVAVILMATAETGTALDIARKDHIEKTGDVLEDLEAEMVNDAVDANVSSQYDLQDWTAARIFTPIAQGDFDQCTLDEDELIDLANWLNRRRHALTADDLEGIATEPVEVHALLSAMCITTSEALLTAALD